MNKRARGGPATLTQLVALVVVANGIGHNLGLLQV
jgi:hypothetical protein